MSKQKSYGEIQKARVQNLIDNHKYEPVTGQIVYDASKLEHPEDITDESIKNHITYFNDLNGVTETATAEILRGLHEKDDKVNSVDGILALQGMNINSKHELKATVGEDDFFGISTTMVDHVYSQEATEWLAQQRSNNESLASKLFNK